MTPQQATTARDKAKSEVREHVTNLLRQLYPHGHEDFIPQLVRELELHNDKNHDYAKGGSALGNFERGSKILALYPGINPGDRKVYALILALKQIDAVLWGLSQNITHKVEGLSTRLDDIAVYATIVKCMLVDEARDAEIDRQFGLDLPEQVQGAGAQCIPQDQIVSRREVSADGVREIPVKEDHFAGRAQRIPDLNHSRSHGADGGPIMGGTWPARKG